MATMPQMLCLLCVLTASFGALYFALNSAYDDICDYEGVVDSCTELKRHEPNFAMEATSFDHQWHLQAQRLRNDTEISKCREEVQGMRRLTAYDRQEAYRIVDKCMADFQQCAYENFEAVTLPPSTTPGNIACFDTATGVARAESQQAATDKYVTCITDPAEIDCTICDLFCRTTNWVNEHPDYAALMGYEGVCTSRSCPWEPECSTSGGFFLSATCSVRGCNCPKTRCLGSTTTTVNETIANTTTLTTTSSVSTSTATSTTTTSTTSTTLARRLLELNSLEEDFSDHQDGDDRRLDGANVSNISQNDCVCQAGYVETVLVGRPFRTFFWDKLNQHIAPNDVKFMQGVVIEVESSLSIINGSSTVQTESCRAYFSNKYKYWGPRQVHNDPGHPTAVNARGNHPDLGCGYKGTFQITCKPKAGEPGQCYTDVDISTCAPPSYTEALDDCYKLTGYSLGAPWRPQYDDWLEVEEDNLSTPEPSETVNISRPLDPRKCCDVHVGSTCEMGRQFSGTDVNGTWLPNKSFRREAGYFPIMECVEQAEAIKPCPMVQINHIRSAAASVLKTFPMCESVCNLTSVRKELQQLCNKTLHPSREKIIQDSHKEKIDLMKQGRANLQAWSNTNSLRVAETKVVHDCIDGSMSRRFNSMGMPQYREGFKKLRLLNDCRLHGCKQHQCLRVTRRCDIAVMDTFPERQCTRGEDEGIYECVDKIGIMNLDYVAPGFAIAWFVCSVCLCCAAGIFKFMQVMHDRKVIEEARDREAAMLLYNQREALKAASRELEVDENGQVIRNSNSATEARLMLLNQEDPENQIVPVDHVPTPASRMGLAKNRAKMQLLIEEQEENKLAEGTMHPNAMPALTNGATGNAMRAHVAATKLRNTAFEEDHRVIVVRGKPVPLEGRNDRRQGNNQRTLEELAATNSNWLQIPDRRDDVQQSNSNWFPR